MNYLKKVVLICVIVMVFFASCALAASGQHEVTVNRLYFREGKSSDSKAIATLSKGTVVTVLSTGGGWAKARWNGEVGYLSEEYLEKIHDASVKGSNTTKLSGTGWAENDTDMYEAADTSSDKVKRISKGTELSICGETMSFYYVKADGKYGYIVKSRVGFEEVKTEKKSSQSKSASSDNSSNTSSNDSSLLKEGSEGERVEELQERLCELGYLNKRYITGYFGSLTDDAVKSFQLVNSLSVDGVVGSATTKKLNSSSAKKRPEVIEMDWYDSNIHYLVEKRGGTAKMIDCRTGIVINIRRVGGVNHMDVEPRTDEDTEKLLKVYGGSWSWHRRPVILVVGDKYIAASINGMPHGAEISTSNNFDGQFCLHTTNSKTHGSDRVDSGHQSCIREALNYDF